MQMMFKSNYIELIGWQFIKVLIYFFHVIYVVYDYFALDHVCDSEWRIF